jgi:hypothetical protein
MKPIKPKWRIPKGYDRFFYFEESSTGFKLVLIFSDRGFRIGSQGKASKLAESRSLDWLHEMMEFTRRDCARRLRKKSPPKT